MQRSDASQIAGLVVAWLVLDHSSHSHLIMRLHEQAIYGDGGRA